MKPLCTLILLTFLSSQFVCSEAVAGWIGQSNGIGIDSKLSLDARRSMRSERYRFVTISDGAESNVFEDPKLFPDVWQVTLKPTPFTSIYLKDLARNYPQLRNLVVTQGVTLTVDDLANIRNMRLKYLTLTCRVSGATDLSSYLPSQLRWLQIAHAFKLPPLNSLEDFCLENCNCVQPGYLSALQMPKLATLSLRGSVLEPSVLSETVKLNHLKQLNLYNSILSSNSELLELKRVSKFDIQGP